MGYRFLILIWSFVLFTAFSASGINIRWAKIQSPHLVQLKTEKLAGEALSTNEWKIQPPVKIDSVVQKDQLIEIYTRQPFRLTEHYYLHLPQAKPVFLVPDGILDSLYSDKPLGYRIAGNRITFRLFAPRAKWVRLVLFRKYNDQTGKEFKMNRNNDGTWEFSGESDWRGKYYGYRVWGPTGEGEMFDSTVVVADPYSPAVVTLNHYTHPGKTLILPPDDFDWEDDSTLSIPWRDLIIYEMHIRDLTAHPSSGLPEEKRGYYTSLLEKDQKGGLPYIRSLGVNAVELLPAQDFGNREVPYRDPNAPVFNTWNPYARNHWGYMTSYFFAPESYYATGGTMQPGKYCGADGRQITEFKQMVKAFHRNGMAVLMDVVYNHVSQYDYNPLKYIDKFYYFRLNTDCSFTSVSGCGNDLKTERPMVRRLIIDSVIHWMTEYHIDGFRFDLAKLIDWQTIDLVREAALQINPAVILIAEPWGGGYDPAGFSDHGWASWNDQIRNGVKGQNPYNGLGFIFGKWQGNNNRQSLRRYVLGSLRQFGGQYRDAAHSVNYLESHDDHTLGDFIRIGLGEVDERQRITDLDAHARLTSAQLRLNKLAALFLFTSQGAVMIHEGQEFARSKVIVKTDVPDPDWGRIDHNSYNKDNATNWLNFNHAQMNVPLLNYYRGLIRMRRAHPSFRHANPGQIHFIDYPDSLILVYRIDYGKNRYLVLLNGNPEREAVVPLSGDGWQVLADNTRASDVPLGVIRTKEVHLPPSSGMVLLR